MNHGAPPPPECRTQMKGTTQLLPNGATTKGNSLPL